MEEYKRVKISDLSSNICSGGTPKSTCSRYYGGEIPWLNTKEINFNRIYSTEKTISIEGLNNSSAKWIDKNSITVAMYGATAGKSAIVKIPLTTNQACCNITIDPNKADYRFVYYALNNDYQRLASLANGGAQQNLNAQRIKDFDIPYPTIFVQKSIANLLSSLDDKIELNRRINDNLEQQAQGLFDDCLANSHSTSICKLSDIADINPRRIISKTDCNRYIEMSNLPTKGSFPIGWEYKQFNGGMKFSNGDTIMARITPCLENGKVAYINFLEGDEVAFGSTEYIVISSKGEYPSEWFYFLTRNKQFVDYAIKNMNGSSGRQRVAADSIAEYELPFIAKRELNSAFSIAKIALKTIKNNSIENMRLSAIRDALLPKLMSGELKVNDLNS